MPDRLEIARRMGADQAIDARDDVAARLRARPTATASTSCSR